MENLEAKVRDISGNFNGRKERRQGKIPGILYGKNVQNVPFDVDAYELNRTINRRGQYGFININLNGKEHRALIKEIQRDPVTHKVMHIDLEEINGNERCVTEIPVLFEGEDILKSRGYITQKFKNSIKVRCNVNNMPTNVSLDVSSMHAGDNIRVSDVEFGSEITIVDETKNMLIAILDPGTHGTTTNDDEDDDSEDNQ